LTYSFRVAAERSQGAHADPDQQRRRQQPAPASLTEPSRAPICLQRAPQIRASSRAGRRALDGQLALSRIPAVTALGQARAVPATRRLQMTHRPYLHRHDPGHDARRHHDHRRGGHLRRPHHPADTRRGGLAHRSPRAQSTAPAQEMSAGSCSEASDPERRPIPTHHVGAYGFCWSSRNVLPGRWVSCATDVLPECSRTIPLPGGGRVAPT
jgi:hypothetical protein